MEFRFDWFFKNKKVLTDIMYFLNSQEINLSSNTLKVVVPSPTKIIILLTDIVNSETFKESKSQNENESIANHSDL